MTSVLVLQAVALCLITAGPARAEDFALSASCDRQEVRAGQEITVTIRASWEGAEGGKYIISEATFPKMRNLDLESSQSFGYAVPAAAGARFERKLVYTFTAKEPGDAETGPIEVKYYRPEVKHEKVASEDTKKEPTAPITRTLPTLTVKVTSRTTSTVVPILILGCAGGVIAFFAFRLLRKK